MSLDDTLDAGNLAAYDAEYGQPTVPPFHAPPWTEGHPVPVPVRPELLGDRTEAFWLDVWTWMNWNIVTYRLVRWFPKPVPGTTPRLIRRP